MQLFVGLVLGVLLKLARSTDPEVLALIGDILEHRAKILPTGLVTALICRNGMGFPDAALMKSLSKRNIMIASYVSGQNFLTNMESGVKLKEPCTHVLDLSCKDSDLVLQEANVKKMFASRNRWLLLLENGTLPKFGDLNVFLDTDVTLVTKTSRARFVLEEVYRVREKLFRQRIGTWEMDKGVIPTASLVVASRRINLQKSVVNSIYVESQKESLTYPNDVVDWNKDIWVQLNYALFCKIMDYLNASTNMIMVDTWGVANNGTWDGQMGYFQRGDADLGVTGMLVKKDRLPVLWYITCATPTRGAFIFRQPPLSSVENIFSLPLSRTAWESSALLVILIGILLYIAFRWERREQMNTDELPWSDIMLISVGAVCQQGYERVARSFAGRILTITLLSLTVFIHTSYSAFIVALLQSSSNSIRTLSDLYHSDLELGVDNISVNQLLFPQASDPLQHAIYKYKISPPDGPKRFMDKTDGIRKIRDGKFAFHVEIGIGHKLISQTFKEEEKCGLQMIDFYVDVKDPYVIVGKKSPFKEILTLAHRRINDVGLRQREYIRYYGRVTKCAGAGSVFVNVGITDCRFAFFTLLYGFLSALFVLGVEFLFYKWRQKVTTSKEEISLMKNSKQYPVVNIWVENSSKKRAPRKMFIKQYK